MSEQKIEVGMKVKVLAKGQFNGQIVEVLERITSRHTRETSYRLNTTWGGIPYPALFDRDEIEIVQDESSHE